MSARSGWLSDWTTEALADRFCYTPLGNLLVRLLLPTRVRANQVSFASMCAGIASGVCYALWTPATIVAAGLFVAASVILDAADGALARARKAPSEIGKLFDNAADGVKGGSIALGLALGMHFAESFGPPVLPGVPLWVQIWGTSALTGFGLLWQVTDRNHFVSQWELFGNGVRQSSYASTERLEQELAGLRAQGGFWLERVVLAVLLPFAPRREAPAVPVPPPVPGYRERLLPYVHAWTFFNGAAQLSVICLASIAGTPLWGMLAVVAGSVCQLPLRWLTLAAHRRALRAAA